MMIRTRAYLVPFALCIMAFSLTALIGCGRDSASTDEKPASHTPESYMNDPEFREKLEAQRARKKELLSSRAIIESQMKAKIDAAVKEHGTNDMAAVRAALDADPEWRELRKRCSDANKALTENRRKTNAIVGARLRPPSAARKISDEKPAEQVPAGKISK